MARLANQLVQVLATYATRPYTWGSIWVPLFCIALTLQIQEGESQADSFFVGFFAGSMCADLVRDQTRHQFAHPRSALLPGFALPHLLVVVAFAVCAVVPTPAILTMTLGTDFLLMTAVASATFAVTSAQYRFSENQFIHVLFPMLVTFAVFGLYMFGLSLWNLNITDITFTPASSIILLAASWTIIAANLVQLVRLCEDETAYHTSECSTAGRRLEARRWYTRKWGLSDMWNDRIRGFHHEDRQRIIRLLRHGVGPWPPEFLAISFIAIAVLYSSVLIYGEETGELGDVNNPLATFRLVPVLFGLLFPGAVAPPLARGRPILAAELLLPLSRKQLIDNLIIASAWNFAVLWTPFNALAVYLIWTAPGLDPSLLRITTFVFLSAAASVAMFGFALSIALWESLFERTIVAVFSAVLSPVVFLTWWFTRDAMSDVPFWIVGALLLSLGMWATRQARLAWLKLELGIRKLD